MCKVMIHCLYIPGNDHPNSLVNMLPDIATTFFLIRTLNSTLLTSFKYTINTVLSTLVLCGTLHPHDLFIL